MKATLRPDTFELIEATPLAAEDGDEISLEPAVVMYTIMKGLADSMPQVPSMPAGDSAFTLIGHPGYEE